MLPAVRFVRWTVLASVWVTIVVSVVLAGRSPSSPQSMSALFGGGTEQTPWGPLGPADRDMLIKVRQANLWEGPVAEQAAQRATSPAVREVGRKIALEHAQLDADLRTVAAKLNLALPSQPSDQQKVWLAQITGASAANFDKTFVNLVRSAHGEVMPLVEGSRSGTQNELVRQFGIEASQFIGRHMDYLESTGLVDYALFPASTAPVARLSAIGGYNVPVTLLLFVMAVLVSGALLRGMSQPRPGAPRRTEQGAWWRRAGRAAGGPALSALSALSGQSRRRRAAAEHTVTTAELIAVLNPPSAHGGGELVSGEGAAVIPAGASALGLVPEPTPPDLVAARRTGPRVTADVLGATAGSALDTTGARRPGHVPSQRVGAPVQAGLAARTASAELPVPSSHRVTRAVWAAEAAPHGAPVDRKPAERKPADRKPPKLGRATRCRPW